MRFPVSRRSRGWLLLVLAAVAVAVTGALALEGWRATSRHRAAAERALRDHATFAAMTLRAQFIARAWVAVDGIFRDVGHGRGIADETALPRLAAIRAAADRLARCTECGPAFHPRYFFRLMVADGALEVDGPPLSEAHRIYLRDEARHFKVDGEWREWDYASFADTLGSAPQLVYLAARRAADGSPIAVYGFGVDLEDVGRTFLRPTLEEIPLLPIPEPTTLTNDSLLAVSILRPDGRFALDVSPHPFPGLFAAAIPASRFLGSWTLRVVLDPETAPRLLVGGLPRSRAPLLAGLGLAAAALFLAAIVVAWRALELADLRAEFVASVSHELRTPLAQILLFGESLTLGTMRTRRDVKVAGHVIVGETRRLLRLVENVLQFGRTARGAEPPAQPEPLAPLVRDVVAGFTPVASAAESRLAAVRLEEVEAPADGGAIRQVLLNLLDNAVKYGPRGQTVSLGLAMADGRARLWVEDEGPGIPPADRARVWRPFVRLERDVDRQTAGSGIGLALVREIVARHRGTATIESTPAGGTRVVVELPDAQAAEASCAS